LTTPKSLSLIGSALAQS